VPPSAGRSTTYAAPPNPRARWPPRAPPSHGISIFPSCLV
jgi:hypothetical protein